MTTYRRTLNAIAADAARAAATAEAAAKMAADAAEVASRAAAAAALITAELGLGAPASEDAGPRPDTPLPPAVLAQALTALGYGEAIASDLEGGGALPEPPPAPEREPEAPLPFVRPVIADAPKPGGEARESRPQPVPPPAKPTREGRARPEPLERADYSWNEFWRWARGLGYSSKAELEAMLGVEDLNKGTPREARELLLAYRREHGERE